MKTKLTQIKTILEDRGIGIRGVLIWLLAAAVVLTGSLALGNRTAADRQVFPVHISEVLGSNTSLPNPDGRCCDYIELCNSADYPVDLSGFQLGDIAGNRRYVFPTGTVLQPGEYLLVYCDKTRADGSCAPFEINRSGAETFCLVAKNGAVVDQVTTLPMDMDQSMSRLSDGTWLVTAAVTPGRGYESHAEVSGDIYNPQVSPVRLSEFSVGDTGYLPEYGLACDWVELHNTSAEPVDISGFILSDNVGNDKYRFPEGTVIQGGGFLVVNCTDRVSDGAVAPFGLSREVPETLVLKNGEGLIAEIVYSRPAEGGTMALDGDAWVVTREPSPGYENTDRGCRAFLEATGAVAGSVRISEVMAGEQLVLPDAYGEFSDWVELYNTTQREIDLAGWCLSDDPADPQKWIIRDLVLQPGQRAVIFCSGRGISAAGELHADFSLSSGGESLTLSAWPGIPVDSVTFPEAQAHKSFLFDEEGQPVLSEYATPGFSNDEAGYEAFCTASAPVGPLAIWEVMTSNDKYLPQLLGQCYDWVELRNISGSELDLTGYSISDDPGMPGMHMLKPVTLAPGETVVLILCDEEGMVKPEFDQAKFVLNVREDQLFLFDPQGKLLDYVYLKEIPLGYSYGRSEAGGGFFYMEPSPQNPNYAGCRLISGAVVSSYAPGVYSQEEGFTVTLEAEGPIYYTTDGSVPDAGDALWEGELRIEETMVLRAVSIEAGKMAGEVYTATFIVGDSHQLPVVSLVTEPSGLWGRNGVYRNGDISVKEVRLPAHVSYSGSDGSFAINCAMNLHGATTVTSFEKKTFAVRFEDRFDGPLHYDVFEDGEVTAFSSLLIRTAHESTFSSQMHDTLICYVASQCSDNVLSQKYKYVALYLNGEYWGLYALRERHSAEHYASYMNVPADSVETVRWMIDEDNNLKELFEFCQYSNLNSEANYAYAKSVVDMDSFVDWLIFEAYMSNVDVNANLRYYRSSVDGIWRLGLADLDLGMVGSRGAFDQMAETFHHGVFISDLLDNKEFQHLLATRLAELLEGPLSDANMIATINQMADIIRPEAAWEEARWGTSVYDWENTVEEMIRFCDGRAEQMIDSLCQKLHFTGEQREAYFGHLE